jgi:ketosteroid isomerase-like protein
MYFLIVPLLTVAVSAQAQQMSEVDALVSTGSVLNAWNTASLKKDAHGAAAFFTESAIRITPQGIITGRAAIEKSLDAGFKVFTLDSGSADQAGIVLAEGVMARTGTWSGTYNGVNGPMHQKGYWSATLVRDGDTWKIRQEMFNVSPASQ